MLRVTGTIAVVLFALLTGVVAVQVANRLVLHLPIVWSEEAARFLFFWVVLLGAAVSVRRRRHFVLDVIPRTWLTRSRTRRFLLDAFPDVCVLAFTLVLAAQGMVYVRAGTFRTAPNSGVNMALVYLAIPVFAALGAVYSALNLLADYRRFRDGRTGEPQPPAAE
jgi:TRAP-type C4-dicarboxylate transport system permease small subunit